MTESAPTRVRRDAARNRERLLVAAESAFATGGFAVPAETVAAEAGVSIATLYRHFPDREALIAAVQTRVNDEWNALLATACENERGWDGLVGLLSELGDRAAAQPGFGDMARLLVARGYPGSDRWNRAWAELIGRAHAQGDLRSDITGLDVGAVMIGHVMVVSTFEPFATGMRRRHLQVLLEGLRAPARPR